MSASPATPVEAARRSGCPLAHRARQSHHEADAAQSIRASRCDGPRAGVLLVNHGSHSPNWRRMLLDVHAEVQDELLALPGVSGVRTAFMEYTEPSIATQLKAFDDDNLERIILVPLLLTVSEHSFDDIPVICGMRNDQAAIASLAKEGIDCFAPRAEIAVTPLLDYPKLVLKNIARRTARLRQHHAGSSARDGLVLVGYGSEQFNNDWEACFAELCEAAVRDLNMAAADYCWCGHIVRYRCEPTVAAIERVLSQADRALVLPILVAEDEMFQWRIVGGAVERIGRPDRVLYAADAILPEPEVHRWIVEIAAQTLAAVSCDHA